MKLKLNLFNKNIFRLSRDQDKKITVYNYDNVL